MFCFLNMFEYSCRPKESLLTKGLKFPPHFEDSKKLMIRIYNSGEQQLQWKLKSSNYSLWDQLILCIKGSIQCSWTVIGQESRPESVSPGMCTLHILCTLTILLCHRGLQVKQLFDIRLSFPLDGFVPMNLLQYLVAGVRCLKRGYTNKEIPGQLPPYNLNSPSLTGPGDVWASEIWLPVIGLLSVTVGLLKGHLHTLLGRFQWRFWLVLVVTIMWLLRFI